MLARSNLAGALAGAIQVSCLWTSMLIATARATTAFQSTALRSLLFQTTRTTLSVRFMSSSSSSSALDTALLGKVQIPIATAIKHHSECVFFDGSWWLDKNRPTTNRQDFEAGPRIAGAHFFDIDDVCAPPGSAGNPKSLPHMMPSAETFATAMDAFGVVSSRAQHIVVYGQAGCGFVHRAWFQLCCMGHDYGKVHLLEGSLQDWIDAGGPVDDETLVNKAVRVADLDASKPALYQSSQTIPRNVVDMDEIRRLVDRRDNTKNGDDLDSTLLVDVRSPERFHGTVAEKRPGLQRGHMPTAKNLFSATLLDPENPNKLKPRSQLQQIIKQSLGASTLDSSISSSTTAPRKIVASCGSGVSACTMAAALIECGVDPEKVYIYDGSWTEWGGDPENPVVKED